MSAPDHNDTNRRRWNDIVQQSAEEAAASVIDSVNYRIYVLTRLWNSEHDRLRAATASRDADNARKHEENVAVLSRMLNELRAQKG